MLRARCLSTLLCLLVPTTGWALDPGTLLSQYAHAVWRVRDGAFTGAPLVLAQTPDGYLWVGTNSGLLRFDGVRFVRWAPEGRPFPPDPVMALRPARDGSLWIGTRFELYRRTGETLTRYATLTSGVATIAEDRQGTIWFGVLDPVGGAGSFCQALESGPRCYEAGSSLFHGADVIAQDAQGDFWIGGDTFLVHWNHGVKAAFRPAGLQDNVSQRGVAGVVPEPDDSLWVGFNEPGAGLGLQQLRDGRFRPFVTSGFDSETLTVTALHRDRDGALWIGTSNRGVYRIVHGAVEHLDSTSGLSGNYVYAFTEDREGSVWVATTEGLDRFSDTRAVSFSTAEGLCTPEVDTVVPSRSGGVWVGGDGALTRLVDGRVSCVRAGEGLPGHQVTSLLEDHAGRLWVGLDTTLWVYDGGTFHPISNPDGSDLGMVTGITEDAKHDIWIAVGGSPRKVMRIAGMAVQDVRHDASLPRRVAADPAGGLWVGMLHGDLAHDAADGRRETLAFDHDDAALLFQVLARPDGSVLAATSYGLIGQHQGRRFILTTRNGLPCDVVYAMTVDASEDLWLFTACALVRVSAADLQTWMRSPDAQVSMERLDAFDGVQLGESSFASGATTTDGRVWFANTTSLVMVDPAGFRRNTIPPPVHVEHLVADRTAYSLGGIVRLPPLTRDVEIDYTALSFVAPAKVQFRYRLEGRDDAWQDAGTRRQAFYSDLPPGSYRFRVIASNNEGVWNEQGAELQFVVSAAWYQTRTFWAACVVAGLFAVWSLYQLRMRQVARALSARFDERLAERTRMARDIHDTLLQTVQGSKMVADSALAQPDDVPGLRQAMAQVSTWLGQAVSEGRAAVQALRASTEKTNDLAEALDRALEDCRRQHPIHASLSVDGEPRELHPVVRDEVYRIAYEAIRNACTHSGGSRLDVELSYHQDLTVRVADDGRGMDPAVAARGRDGHYGVQGMRERAARIGATLAIVSAPGAGTDLRLTVPGRAIFRKA
ncbi:MAG: two-component regulator propeller domain-containing protein [Vicinamibacterales bacterium]